MNALHVSNTCRVDSTSWDVKSIQNLAPDTASLCTTRMNEECTRQLTLTSPCAYVRTYSNPEPPTFSVTAHFNSRSSQAQMSIHINESFVGIERDPDHHLLWVVPMRTWVSEVSITLIDHVRVWRNYCYTSSGSGERFEHTMANYILCKCLSPS